MKILKQMETLDQLKSEPYMLCSLKDIRVVTNINYKTKSFISNKELLMRAIINIISNAVDYSPPKSEIEFVVSENEGMLMFTISDLW